MGRVRYEPGVRLRGGGGERDITCLWKCLMTFRMSFIDGKSTLSIFMAKHFWLFIRLKPMMSWRGESAES